MKKALTFFCLLVLSSSILLANGLSLNSPGPKALGMGGAFIGIADDQTAIYWNPAGLSQLKTTQISAYYSGVMPASTYKLDAYKVDAKSESALYHVPGLFASWPCQLLDNLTIGVGIYIPAGLGTTWKGSELVAFSGMPGQVGPAGTEYEWMSQIGAIDFSPTLSYAISDQLSVGAGLNVRYGMFDIKRPMDLLKVPDSFGNPLGKDGAMDTQYEETSTGTGFGVTVGVLYKPMDILSIGLTFKSENKVSFEGTAKNSTLKTLMGTTYKDADLSRDLAWPMWFGGGIAVKPMDNLTVAFDVQFSQWSKTEDEIETTYENWKDPATGETMKENLNLHWKDATQIRFGLQYDVNEDLAVRAGFYLDPAPAPDETMNILFPSQNYNAITAGCSYDMGAIGIDFGFEYLMGDDRDIPVPTTPAAMVQYADAMPGIHHTDIIAFSLGLRYDFGK